jgi:hypothetical protein
MDIILCSGMMRSASTWSFNVCRLLASEISTTLKVTFKSVSPKYEELDNYLRDRAKEGILVIKSHFQTDLAIKLIHTNMIKNVCTIRDPRDCVASRQLFEKESFERSVYLIETCLFYVGLFQRSNNTLYIRYEEMVGNPYEYIKLISHYLGFPIDETLVREIDNQTNKSKIKMISDTLKTKPHETLLRVDSHVVDPVTQIHENHIQGGICGRWKTELNKDQIKIVTDRFKPWLITLGYETEASIENLSS